MRTLLGLGTAICAFLGGTCNAAADTWNFNLIPSSGVLAGPAGSTLGWGYEIQNLSTSDWLVTTDVNSGSFLRSTPALLFDFPVLDPGSSVDVPFDANIPAGLFALSWDVSAPTGFTNVGDFTVSAEWWTGDPLNGGAFIADASDMSQPYSAIVTAAPEPLSFRTFFVGLLGIVAVGRGTKMKRKITRSKVIWTFK